MNINYTLKKFEELTNTELYKILQLREEVFIVEQACIYPDIDNKDEHAHHLTAFEGCKLVGYLRILGKGVSFAEVSIGRVIVPKTHRGRGIAKKIMQDAIDFIGNELGEKQIRISAQSYAIPFYKGLGFEIVSEEYLEDDIPHVEMLCNISCTNALNSCNM